MDAAPVVEGEQDAPVEAPKEVPVEPVAEVVEPVSEKKEVPALNMEQVTK